LITGIDVQAVVVNKSYFKLKVPLEEGQKNVNFLLMACASQGYFHCAVDILFDHNYPD